MNNTTYSLILKQAEMHFDKIQEEHPTSFACRNGCHACCEPNLTVLPVEAQNIRSFIKSKPQIQRALETIQNTNPHNGTRCDMLNAEGGCVIYPVRPFICRSHGAPIAIARDEYFQIDVCPLNFTHNPIEKLGPENFFILDDWNDRLFGKSTEFERIPLTLSGLKIIDT